MTDPRFVSYAQNLEDVMLWRALRDAVPSGGFYVDVGASDPALLSVTRAFYDRGWRGVDIEPLPDQAKKLRAARPRDVVVQAALGAAPGQRAFHRVTKQRQTGLSTFDADIAAAHAASGAEIETFETPVTTLAEVWSAHVDGPVHFLKIDIEGAEAEVLAGADFTLMRPWIVVIEATPDAAAAGPAWEPGLLAAGYRFVWFDGLNRFYLAEEHAELAGHFRVPPNIFDAYVQHDAALMDHLAAVDALAGARGAMIDTLRTELSRHAPPPAALAATPPPHDPPPPAKPAGGLLRRLAMLFYRPVRPIARPLVWRARTFFLGPLLQEMTDLRQRLEELQALGASLERMMLTVALDAARTPDHTARPQHGGLSNPPADG